jgi:hypothetical protein
MSFKVILLLENVKYLCDLKFKCDKELGHRDVSYVTEGGNWKGF